ncbi:hypothetical protein HY523_02020 [Candidatus Berkelbacteria bacterium]|nr:hypothetical protein [Candidatus Berkelbacteria bacterium]
MCSSSMFSPREMAAGEGGDDPSEDGERELPGDDDLDDDETVSLDDLEEDDDEDDGFDDEE